MRYESAEALKKMSWLQILCFVIFLVLVVETKIPNQRSFTIGYDENAFLKDGQPFRYISGSIHYFRVPREYWSDRLTKMKAAGLNTIQTYIEWSSHEPEPGQYTFDGNLDLVEFIKTAENLGLYVIIRPGPYIDSERDFGGLPYWLLANKNIRLRTMDPDYMQYVERWFAKLLPLISPLMFSNGGPVLMLQVENEYGSYIECDRDYTARLAYVMRELLGLDALLFTTDGNNVGFLECGYTDGVYPTIDFGSGADVNSSFAALRTREMTGPLANSEYYPGWMDHWGYPHSNVPDSAVAKTLDEMLAVNASVNIYVFHGGTSFGFKSGSNYDDGKQLFFSCPTSYDFDAPISEAGDLTSKYFALQDVIKKYAPVPEEILRNVTSAKKMKFGPVQVTEMLPMIPQMRKYLKPVHSTKPLSFEELKLDYGLVGYETLVTFQASDPSNLTVSGLCDRGYVYVEDELVGILSREKKIISTSVLIKTNQRLIIIVENQGRIDYGSHLKDFKGILGDVTLDNKLLTNWTMYPFDIFKSDRHWTQLRSLLRTKSIGLQNGALGQDGPGVYFAAFELPNGTQPEDTFLKLDGWTKGVAIFNDINLGRYWPIAGPQITLYVPGVWFKPFPEPNTLFLLEFEQSPCGDNENETETCTVEFVENHIINGNTPNKIGRPLFQK